ncbi:MFS transporter [Bacillus sp. JCM 19034]|uniref:MFS transporter n=1 Tax=Bacillus sp. JCM 19034 TaxID=1481928 RepID=UPI00078586E9|nr:MFS transporter [Bacillus sp. JCM 19034]
MIMNLLKHRHFRYFFLSDIISGFGVGMATIGANWFILEQTGAASIVGFMLSINVIAGFLASLVMGGFIDRFQRRKVIQWTYWIRAMVIFAITVLIFLNGFNLIYMYMFFAINGIGWAVYMSASRSLIQELLTEKELIKGNSLVEVSLQVGMFLAGGASGFLYQFWGFEIILVINASVFMISSFFLSNVRYNAIPIPDKKEPFINALKNGMNFLFGNSKLFFLGVVPVIPLVATMIFNVVLPSYVSDTLKADAIIFGISDMFYGVGGLLSGFLAAPLVAKLRTNKVILMFFGIAVAVLFSLVFNHLILALYAGSLFIGLSNSTIRIVMNTKLMQMIPKHFMGRAMSVWMAISFLLQTISASAIGIFMDLFNPAVGFLAMAVLMFFGGLIFTLTKKAIE